VTPYPPTNPFLAPSSKPCPGRNLLCTPLDLRSALHCRESNVGCREGGRHFELLLTYVIHFWLLSYASRKITSFSRHSILLQPLSKPITSHCIHRPALVIPCSPPDSLTLLCNNISNTALTHSQTLFDNQSINQLTTPPSARSVSMPYAVPSPMPSPSKDHRKGWLTPPTHIEDMGAGPSYTTGPMPGIPRRSSSHQGNSGHSTPRSHSPAMSRQVSSSSTAFPASKPMEGLPRRTSAGQGTFGVTGLPNLGAEGSLGLKLLPSPTKSPQSARAIKESISSVPTVDSSLPTTPDDDNSDLPTPVVVEGDSETKEVNSTKPSVPFPSFEPPVFRPVHTPHRALSQTAAAARPSMINARRSSAIGHHRGNGPTGSLQIPFPTSASTSHIPGTPQSPSQHLRPTASMIRKKSGEVVKPSLKLRSMSTPDLSRQKEGASPDTPEMEANRDFPDERSKSVRFADGDDGDPKALESVVLFLREQRPTAVGKAADPDHTGVVTDTETEADDTDASDFVQFRTRRNAAARAADEQGQVELEGGSRVPRLRTDFSPDARGSLEGENILLERVELVNGPGPLCLRGTVIVRNVSFQKWVSIRFTLDHWQ